METPKATPKQRDGSAAFGHVLQNRAQQLYFGIAAHLRAVSSCASLPGKTDLAPPWKLGRKSSLNEDPIGGIQRVGVISGQVCERF